jgi:hypothetical protein
LRAAHQFALAGAGGLAAVLRYLHAQDGTRDATRLYFLQINL